MLARLLRSQLSPQCPEQTLVIEACSPLPEHLPRGLKGQLCSLSALSNVMVPSLCLSSLLCKVGRTIDTPSEETTYLRHMEHMESAHTGAPYASATTVSFFHPRVVMKSLGGSWVQWLPV